MSAVPAPSLTAADVGASRQAARRREIVERVLPIVEHLLDSGESYRNLPLERILQASRLSRSTFYRYFGDKYELLVALSEPALATVMEAATRPWRFGREVTREKLEQELSNTIEIYRPHVALTEAMFEAAADDPRVKDQIRAGYESVRVAIAEHLRTGQAEGFIRPDLHPEETAGWLTWMGERGMSQLVPGADDAAITRLAESLAAIVWSAIYDVR
jgi:AcrR family transcriptional regulator